VIDTYKKIKIPSVFAREAVNISKSVADFTKWYSGIKTNEKYKKYMFIP
jgi:hypothetical protein